MKKNKKIKTIEKTYKSSKDDINKIHDLLKRYKITFYYMYVSKDITHFVYKYI
jgi:hypothetical protein